MNHPMTGVASTTVHERIMAETARVRAMGEASSRLARDPVNQPHINDWVEAMGNTNPRFAAATGTGEAPPSMIQAWTMYGLVAPRDPNDPLHVMMGVLTAEGYTGVLGTNCEQTYERYLRVGEQLRVTSRLDSVVGPKKTGMGEGYFVTSVNTWYVEHEDGTSEKVGEMLFRVLKFKPKPSSAGPGAFVLYPTRNRDSDFFWEGTAAGELRIQKCAKCGALRHPPGPTCPECLAFDRTYIVSPGTGTVFSYVVHHHPPIPGYELPIRVALVDLDEGVRMVANADSEVEIGDRVQVAFRTVDDTLTLPYWTKGDPTGNEAHSGPGTGHDAGQELPAWSLPLTTTLIVSTAIATRDYQDVHHDRDLAQGAGSDDIFVNILTSNGLVERYITEQFGRSGIDVDLLGIAIRLGAPAYPGDTLTFSGRVQEVDGDVVTVAVRGAVSLGEHVTGTVRLRTKGSK